MGDRGGKKDKAKKNKQKIKKQGNKKVRRELDKPLIKTP